MKYHRLRIRNYRGVEDSEIRFQVDGLTLVQGPNEIGKSSLREAIGILFDFPASSQRKDVVAIRPVHKDEGPEIELEAESGPYRFVYRKRYHKKPETTLRVTAPQAENLTGRQAHERATQILAETLDVDLWKALTWVQGDALDQPNLEGQQSLSAALDRAAGGSSSGAAEETLFGKVEQTYQQYFTPTGREKGQLSEARLAETAAAEEVAHLQAQLDQLDSDIEKAARLDQEHQDLEVRATDLEAESQQHRLALQTIERSEAQLREAQLEFESAQAAMRLAQSAQDQRLNLIDLAGQALRDYQAVLEASNSWLTREEEAQRRLDDADRQRDQATAELENAERELALRLADADYHRNQKRLRDLQQRRQRIDAARQAAARATEVLKLNRVDEDCLRRIEQAERKRLMIQAQREAAAPQVQVRSLRQLTLLVDGQEITLPPEETIRQPVPDRWKLVIPDQLELELRAGSSSDELNEQWEQAGRHLRELCRNAGVDDLQAAQAAHAACRQAQASLAESQRIEAELLGGQSFDQLDAELRQLAETLPDYPQHRDDAWELAEDLEIAQQCVDRAQRQQQACHQRVSSTNQEQLVARQYREAVQRENLDARVRLNSLQAESQRLASQLETARQQTPDQQLRDALEQAGQQLSSKQQQLTDRQQALAAHQPQRVRTLLETSEQSLATCRRRLGEVQTERAEIRARLQLRGEEGLYEKREAAQGRLERLAAQNRSLFRQAEAAQLLYLTMKEERDAARRSYVAPLKQRIESLGRLMFDETFEIQMDDNLRIDARTLQGVTVPFESLSGGSREQLSLMFRLACSMIVSQEGGMPLIMDDALGYTDPQRLRRMGAVLAQAARECQIVVLTCVPERYANVGEAHIVPL